MMQRKHTFGLLVSILVAGAIALWPARSNASIIDAGGQGGILKRSLSDVDYNSSFAWQLHAEMTFFPFLMAGPYATFTTSTAQICSSATGANIGFRARRARWQFE